MLRSTTIEFLAKIKNHPTKEWVERHREAYDSTRDDVVGLAQEIIEALDEKEFGLKTKDIDPNRCVSHLNRDMRFNKDKPPYKSDFFVMVPPAANAKTMATYYVHLEPGNCYAGGGAFTPASQALRAIREKIAADTNRWREIVEGASFDRWFPDGLRSPGALKTAPQGFSPEADAIEYLNLKGFCANHPLTDDDVQNTRGLDKIIKSFDTVRPLVDFING